MLGEAREGEKAAPLRAPDSALEGSYVRTGLQVILVNADHPGHFRCPGLMAVKTRDEHRNDCLIERAHFIVNRRLAHGRGGPGTLSRRSWLADWNQW
jgi:hypothetical protein